MGVPSAYRAVFCFLFIFSFRTLWLSKLSKLKSTMIKCLILLVLPLTVFSQTVVSEDFALKTPTGTIQGTLTSPSAMDKNIPLVLLIAGSGPTDRNCNGPGFKTDAYKKLAEALAANGVAMLRYDKRGVAGSMAAATPGGRSSL